VAFYIGARWKALLVRFDPGTWPTFAAAELQLTVFPRVDEKTLGTRVAQNAGL